MNALAAPIVILLAQTWQPAAPGVARMSLGPEAGGAELVRFDLDHVVADVVVPGPEHPQTAAEVRRAEAALAAVNGGFFDEARRSLGLRVASGRTVVPLRPRVDWGVLVVREIQSVQRAEIVHSRELAAPARDAGAPAPRGPMKAAIQVGPRILIDGRPTKLKPQIARRTAVAVDSEGRYLTLVVTRWPTFADQLASALARLGFAQALLLDGGPSAQLAADLGEERLDVPGGYGVPDLLVVRPRR